MIGKYVILGVAAIWDRRKGLDDFIKLREILDEQYQMILVGLTEQQKDRLPQNIMGITRTNSVNELRKLYAMADVFLNPTYEDNFPTTNIEALACGTPVITYQTGGSPEALNRKSGIVVSKGDMASVKIAIQQAKKLNLMKCIEQSRRFEREKKAVEYLDLYY